jgi:putative FmdB family regulatory protein
LRLEDSTMPIYAYRCTSCGHAKDVLQKISDPLLTDCPACGAATFVKQVTAAGFQLKGSGWYVTDFRGGNTGGKASEGDGKEAGKEPGKGGEKAPEPASGKVDESKGAAAPAAAPAASTAPAPSPAAASPAPAAAPPPSGR